MKVLVVGTGLYGSVCAYELSKRGYIVDLIDKRSHIGGNVFTQNILGIPVQIYGAHIFHTSDKKIWDYINRFSQFNNFINSPIAEYKGNFYRLPFNMSTFYELFGAKTPSQARKYLQDDIENIKNPQNAEEQALSTVGHKIYKALIKGYTEKQWHKSCKELPADILKRIPVRFSFDNNYFNDTYQGVPVLGYTPIIEKMLANANKIMLNSEFNRDMEDKYDRIIYTGEIDRYFDYRFGKLQYRSLSFEHSILQGNDNFQGNAVINYTDKKIAETRTIEHKFFYPNLDVKGTVITREFPEDKGEPFYPVNNYENDKLYKEYKELTGRQSKTLFGGRLGLYSYMNMDQVIASALDLIDKNF